MILIFGDNHGEFRYICEVVKCLRPAAIVLLGDLTPERPLHEELAPALEHTLVRFLPGNHDTDTPDYYTNVFHSRLAHCNLHGKVETIAGVRIAGLGGVFRSSIWQPPQIPTFASHAAFVEQLRHKMRKPKVHRNPETAEEILQGQARKHASTIFPDAYRRLEEEKADVLLTHEAPSAHPYGVAALDQLARRMGVRQSFHGHHHDALDYRPRWASLGFELYGVGFQGITAIDGRVVQPGKFDAHWASRRQVR